MAKIPDEVRKRLEQPTFWHLGTVNKDGSPQVTPMWIDVEGDRVILNTAIGRVKEKNLRRDPRLSLSHTLEDNHYDRVEIRGRVIDFIEGEEGERGIYRLAKKYIGEDVYPWRSPGERRVKLVVEPTIVRHETG